MSNTWKIFAFFIVVGVISLFIVANRQLPITPILIQTPVVKVTPTPTPIPPITTKVNSGDGTFTLNLITKTQTDSKSYTLTVTDNQKKTTQTIFTQQFDLSSSLSLPKNAWSPDNKLFFIKESNGSIQHDLVYKASGQPFTDLQLLDIQSFWSNPNLTISDVSGWAGNNLLMVYTSKPDGSPGQNFWFVTDTHKFLPLSH